MHNETKSERAEKMKDEITIDGVVYVPKEQQEAEPFEEMQYAIIRTRSGARRRGIMEKGELP